MHACIQTNIQTYKHSNIQTYKHTNIQTYKHTNIQTYKHTNIHTYIHIYIHESVIKIWWVPSWNLKHDLGFSTKRMISVAFKIYETHGYKPAILSIIGLLWPGFLDSRVIAMTGHMMLPLWYSFSDPGESLSQRYTGGRIWFFTPLLMERW